MYALSLGGRFRIVDSRTLNDPDGPRVLVDADGKKVGSVRRGAALEDETTISKADEPFMQIELLDKGDEALLEAFRVGELNGVPMRPGGATPTRVKVGPVAEQLKNVAKRPAYVKVAKGGSPLDVGAHGR